MEINSLLSNFNIFSTDTITGASAVSGTSAGTQEQSTSRATGGDTVSISAKARELLAQMRANAGVGASTAQETTEDSLLHTDSDGEGGSSAAAQGASTAAGGADEETGAANGNAGGSGGSGSGGAGGSGSSSASSEEETLEAKISAIASQLASLPPNSPQATALQGQLSALQAQLAAAKSSASA